MIFSGDFVHPFGYDANRFKSLDNEFLRTKKMLNFESTFSNLNGKRLTKGIALSSNDSAIESLLDLNVKAVGLANNHIYDFEYCLEDLKERFYDAGIETSGMGNNLDEASRPYVDHEEKLVVLAFGWDVIGCKYADKSRKGVNPYSYAWVEKQLIKYRGQFKEYRIVLYIHWNYELEIYPQPADRQFSFKLIDLGADAIFGHHNHLVSGYEIYKGKPIFYSLGNFYIPQTTYNGHPLKYPPKALIGLSIDYRTDGSLGYFLHRHSADGLEIMIIDKGDVENCRFLTDLSEFRGLTHEQYLDFYRKVKVHRNKLLPTFTHYSSRMNVVKRKLVKLRQIPIDLYSRKLRNYKGKPE